jgi:(E)-4-hydroxy-3-methylbut-2-enyl-diphosphate synthase
MVYLSNKIIIGSIDMGGGAPVRLQSMTNTDTLDTAASVAQCIRIIAAGGELVRLTTQGEREARNLENIRNELAKAGYSTPLVADVHFNPKVAELAAKLVDKVRINPGNYVDKRASFSVVDLSEKLYNEELERIHNRIRPLLDICSDNSTTIRIGVNHGSLSDRIMSRYGNSPIGMAESAMEFIRITRAENFHKLVLSLKSSNSLIMIEATRMLVEMMQREGFAYPLHLGVTEAGEGEDGRIRSAFGIGALLSEGIGDTIRVSLSEPPEDEIPVARMIVESAARHNPEKSRNDEKPGKASLAAVSGTNTLSLCYNTSDISELAVRAAVDSAGYLVEKKATEMVIDNGQLLPEAEVKSVVDGILQAARIKITRNDYISCPTCGRTKFNLSEAVAKVKAATAHLTGLKIAIMGCAVNGPGEMADADFGYVGAGKGVVQLYKGREIVMKNVPEDQAVEELLKIIACSTDQPG